jgi:polyhydroxyalkanoate synthesis repressor PhaR
MPVIKRYPNRKLYDTAAKRYISLDGVAALVRDGADVQVVDHATGEDVTALVLVQVIVEQERRQADFLPQPVLAGLIKAGGETVAGLRRGLAAPLGLLRQVDEIIEQRIHGLIELGELAEADGLHLLDQLTNPRRWAQGPWEHTDELVRRALGKHTLPSRADLQALSDQLDALMRDVDGLSQHIPPDQGPPKGQTME